MIRGLLVVDPLTLTLSPPRGEGKLSKWYPISDLDSGSGLE
jgi:hypothetical protein